MFDGKKIAKQALLRVDEIKAKRKRGRMMKRGAVAMLGLCAASVVIVLLIFPFGKLPDDYIFLDDEKIPLAALPSLQADENAKQYTGTEQGFIIPIISDVTITADTHDVNIVLFNQKDNPCYFVFEIVIEDTEEAIYVSGLIEPGMCIENLMLTKTLAQGKYDAVLKIHFYELETLTSINGADVSFTLSAE